MSDLIDRRQAIEAVRRCLAKEVTPAYMLIDKSEVMTELMMLPSAEPELATNWQPTCNKLATDCISRQAAIDAVEQWEDDHTWDDWCNEHKDEKERFHIVPPSDYIRSLPSAQPKKGKWLPDNTTYEKFWYFVCSECKRATQIPHYMGGFLYNFCPSCGADMRGEEDE